VEAGDVQLDTAARVVQILHHHLSGGHGLPAAVARLPVARAAPDARDGSVWQAAVGEFFLNHETKEGLVHEGLPGCAGSTRQIHRGLGASDANLKGQVQARGLCGGRR
jgi:hypothetical protein